MSTIDDGCIYNDLFEFDPIDSTTTINKEDTSETETSPSNILLVKSEEDDIFSGDWLTFDTVPLDECVVKDVYWSNNTDDPETQLMYDSIDSKSDDSDSSNSLNEQYSERNTKHYKNFYGERKKSGNIKGTQSKDPYLESHRLRLNARQRSRVSKTNDMFKQLDVIIPVYKDSENKRPRSNSKLAILKRAIKYMNDLSVLLSDTNR
ncbi:uncharacterized protein LOC130637428 [Hydractinia symbiolongicarpus]|uniref:uncharacterized protein LOC130637428 n=1 Tax=Hydractinia symbiolongicarpus TaxID=13093 RepID=UPI00254F7491|nr:uncharacterized protein LOC130637428 [Hydractinia symbiolongicarpus]